MAVRFTREHLIAIAEAAIVPESQWHDRDSQGAQKQVGECWALLRAGCEFRLSTIEPCVTDERTIWLEIDSVGFSYFEEGERSEDTFYLPTRASLAAANGKDWYR